MSFVFKFVWTLFVECHSWWKHFQLANLISDWHRAELQLKMRKKGIKFRPTPLPQPLFVLPCRLMVLSHVMLSMWTVALAAPVSRDPLPTWVAALAGVRSLDHPWIPPPRKPPDPPFQREQRESPEPSSGDPLRPSSAREGEAKLDNRMTAEDVAELMDFDFDFCPPCDSASDDSAVTRCFTAELPAHAQSFGHIGLLAGTKGSQAIVDCAASITVTPHRSDFVDYTPLPEGNAVGGIADGCAIAGHGTVHFKLEVGTTTKDLMLNAVHAPTCPERLLRPQQLMVECMPPPLSIDIRADSVVIEFQEGAVTCPENDSSLPVVTLATPTEIDTDLKALNACVLQEQNQNLTPAQKQLLKWHCKLGHLSLQRVQQLLRSGALGHNPLTKAAGRLNLDKSPLICGSCAFGKAKRKASRPKRLKQDDLPSIKLEEKVLSKDNLIPGQKVSMDHFIVSTPGRLFTSRGRESHDRMFKGGVIFVDHASGFVHVEPVVNFTAGEALRAKREFESEMFQLGITVLSYHSDNGVFTAAEFQDQLAQSAQKLTLSGVGAHHQNAMAERAIGTTVSMARTMMLHAKIRWPKGISTKLWPMAMKHAQFLHNHVPNHNNTCPMDLVLKTVTPRHLLRNVHVWGSPCFVLDPKLQDGHKIPKFDPRSRQGVNLGWSPKHASNVPLILNLDSGHVSPQFHVVFDDWFTTVTTDEELTSEALESEGWIDLFTDDRVQVILDPDEDVELSDEWLSEMERLEKHQKATAQVQSRMPGPTEMPPNVEIEAAMLH